MRRREFTRGVLILSAAGVCANGVQAAAALSEFDAAAGVRAALQRGALAAVGLLGRQDGFLGNPQVRIPLPDWLERASPYLRMAGQGARLDELVTAMNRAAESAVPEAMPLLEQAVKQMTLSDARAIVQGGDTSVTDFFASKTREPLTQRFLPAVGRATQRVSAAQQYNELAAQAQGFGLVRQQDASVESYVTSRALDGLFHVIGEEERKIRRDPVATGSALLRRVFGG
jgi:hypothetical protein